MRRLHSAHAHEAAGSSGRLGRCKQRYAPSLRRRRLRSLLLNSLACTPKAPPDARVLLPLVSVYIKGSSRMRCLAAAANDLGRSKHASPSWWPTETTQWKDPSPTAVTGDSAVYLGYRAMWACLVRTAGFVQRFFYRSAHVRYTPAECHPTKRLKQPTTTTQPDRQSALEARPRTPLDLHFGPWQVSRIGPVNNITRSGIGEHIGG